jgi:HEAT repeat protein
LENTDEEKQNVYNLIDQLRNKDGAVRQDAIFKLIQIGEPVIPFLIKNISGEDEIFLQTGVVILGEIRAISSVKFLLQLLEQSHTSQLLCDIIGALGRIGDKQAIEPIINNLKTGDESIRQWAVWALGEIKDESTVNFIIDSLKDANKWVRLEAIKVLEEQLREEKAVEPIIKLLEIEKDVEVRRIAIEALGNLGSVKALLILEKIAKNDLELDDYEEPLANSAKGSIEKILQKQ